MSRKIVVLKVYTVSTCLNARHFVETIACKLLKIFHNISFCIVMCDFECVENQWRISHLGQSTAIEMRVVEWHAAKRRTNAINLSKQKHDEQSLGEVSDNLLRTHWFKPDEFSLDFDCKSHLFQFFANEMVGKFFLSIEFYSTLRYGREGALKDFQRRIFC